MFDWLSITTEVPETWQAIEAFFTKSERPLVTQVSQYGEVLDYGTRKGEYSEIDFALYVNGKTRISFSPHLLYNELHNVVNSVGKAMNHDTFTPIKLVDVFNWLNENFEIEPDHCYIHQLEIGVNLPELGIDTNAILDNVVSYKGRRSRELCVIGTGRSEEFVFGKYGKVKIYNKALQNGLPGSILCFEYKAKKVQPLAPIFGRYPTLSDLLNQKVWRLCGEKLLNIAELCVFNDEFDSCLTARQKAKLSFWQNPKFWEEIQPDTRCKQKKSVRTINPTARHTPHRTSH